jgi:hypothetical protein
MPFVDLAEGQRDVSRTQCALGIGFKYSMVRHHGPTYQAARRKILPSIQEDDR